MKALGEETLFAYEEAFGSVVRMMTHDKDSFQAFVQIIEIATELKEQGITFVDYLENLYEKYGRYDMFQEVIRFDSSNGVEEMNAYISKFREFSVGDKIGEYEITDIKDFSKGYKDYQKENFIFIYLNNDH